MSHLGELAQLTRLSLGDNQISDLNHLKGLKLLHLLRLSDNPALTKAQIAELQKALPKCEIQHNATK